MAANSGYGEEDIGLFVRVFNLRKDIFEQFLVNRYYELAFQTRAI